MVVAVDLERLRQRLGDRHERVGGGVAFMLLGGPQQRLPRRRFGIPVGSISCSDWNTIRAPLVVSSSWPYSSGGASLTCASGASGEGSNASIAATRLSTCAAE